MLRHHGRGVSDTVTVKGCLSPRLFAASLAVMVTVSYDRKKSVPLSREYVMTGEPHRVGILVFFF